jgi:hypothetical protein
MILDPIDQKVRDQGFNFVPFDRYLAEGFQPNTLDMSGGISTLPMSSSMVPPILNINQGGGEGGGGGGITAAPDNSGFDYEFDALGGLNNPDNLGLTDEEQDALDKVQNPRFTKGQIGSLALQGFFNPLGAIINTYRTKKKNEAAAIEAAKEAAAKADFDRAMAQGQGFYDSLNEGRGASVSQTSRDQAGDDPGYSGPSPFAYGGRVPYMMGGLTDLVDIYD